MTHSIVDKDTLETIISFLKAEGIEFRAMDGGIIVPKFRNSYSLPDHCYYGIPASWFTLKTLQASNISEGKPFLWRRKEINSLKRSVPRYLDREYLGLFQTLYSVDIWHCYYQLYRGMFWRGKIGNYDLNKMSYPIGHTFDKLEPLSKSRNAVMGIARSTTEKWYIGHDVELRRKTLNPYLSPFLWSWMMDVLHILAGVAVDLYGAVYVDTDGYMFVTRYEADAFVSFLEGSTIASRRMEGNGTIYSLKNYELGYVQKGNRVLSQRGFRHIETGVNPQALNTLSRRLYNV